MTEAGQFVGFCKQGGFALDLDTGVVDWFRGEGGNYMLDIWFWLHEKADSFINEMDKSGFTRPCK